MARAPRRVSRRRLLLIVLACLVALAWRPVGSHVRAASLLTRYAEPDSQGYLAGAVRYAVDDRLEEIAGTKARVYTPIDLVHAPGLVLVHGVHWKGIDDPRLQRFARTLAASGMAVLTPEIRELADYRIAPESITTIGETSRAFSVATHGKVGLLGLSFGGGLSLLAATDPQYAPSLRFVATVGAHDDLERVLRFFVTDEAPRPDGSIFHTKAHDYGTVVLEYSHVEDFFAPADVDVARETLRSILHEKHDDAVKRAADLSPAGAAKMKLVLDHDVHAMAPELLAEIDHLRPGFAAVSPSAHVSKLAVPAFVLHGAGDTVIPPSEAEWLGKDIPPDMLRADLVSHAIEHVGLEKSTPISEELALVHFMSDLLDADQD